MVLHEHGTTVIRNCPSWALKSIQKFTALHAILFLDISLKNTNVNLVVVLEVREKSGDHQSHKDLFPENRECLYKMSLQCIQLLLRVWTKMVDLLTRVGLPQALMLSRFRDRMLNAQYVLVTMWFKKLLKPNCTL